MTAVVSKTLDELFNRFHYKLDKLFSSTGEIDLYECMELLENYYGTDWEKKVEFEEGSFKKIPLYVNKDAKFEAWLICWDIGANSGIHDHASNGCIQKVLTGVLKETRYKLVKNNKRKKVEKREKEMDKKSFEIINEIKMRHGNVLYIDNGLGYHRIENKSSNNRAVTLHIYSPPNHVTKYFD